jgi:hypothetical protein
MPTLGLSFFVFGGAYRRQNDKSFGNTAELAAAVPSGLTDSIAAELATAVPSGVTDSVAGEVTSEVASCDSPQDLPLTSCSEPPS